MYEIGENIVYPMHGAGTIISIEEKEILGKIEQYYVVKVPTSEIKLMVPVSTAEVVGVRKIIDETTLKKALKQISLTPDESNTNWNKRYREHLQKLKTGDIVQVGTVVKNLLQRESHHVLSTCEKQMLNNAMQIMTSEISLTRNLPSEQIESELTEFFSI